jgi:probable rRNA maturation factor
MIISVTKPTLKLEFNLQDEFFCQNASNLSETIKNAYISSETWQSWLQNWLESSGADLPEGDSYELTLRLTDDQEMQALNSQYRQKNQPTDVLAFAALEADFPSIPDRATAEPIYLGDIIISVDTARQQAEQQGHPLTTELAWLASHGFLHLLGWDHRDEGSLLAMLAQQETLLKSVGLELQEAE